MMGTSRLRTRIDALLGDPVLLRAEANDSLLFSAMLCDSRYKPAKLHRYIANLLERVARKEIDRLILSVPPQHGKSRLVTIEFPAWQLGRDPTKRFVVASYAKDLSMKSARATRERLLTDEYRYLFDTRPDPSRQSADDWAVEGGGVYKAVGVGSALTGHPADVLIIDDPHKDYAEAHSLRIRENVWEWYRSVAYTRLAPDGVVIVIMTRWHADDLVGRLLANREKIGGPDRWTVVNLPALAEENDPLGRKPGQVLWPAQFSEARLKETRDTVGNYIWSALYCGRPRVHGGNLIKLEQMKFVAEEELPAGIRWARFWDLAASEKTAAGPDPDRTAGAKVGVDRDGNCYIADIIAGQWRWPIARAQIKAVAEAERILVGVEAQGGFETAFDNLREVLSPEIKCMPVRVETDKLTRALPWIALADAGKLYLVSGDWNTAFVSEAEEFPLGRHDDMIDAVSGAYALLTRSRKIIIA